MKMNVHVFAFILLFAMSTLSQPLHAQNKISTAKVDIPFGFDYGAKHFGPGAYTLDMQNLRFMTLRDNDHAAFVLTRVEYNRKPAAVGHVVFQKYGDRYFLQEVWTVNSDSHLTVCASKWEQRAARELVAQGTAPSRVELAMVTTPSTPSGN
jgi:hypothetical protein